MTIDLSSLPPPNVIEEISFEAILTELRTDLIERFPDIEPTLQLESAVVNKVMQAFAYRETLFRARVNAGVKANLLYFATGADLDHLANFYDVVRLDGETDKALRERTVLAIQARSPGGSSFWYAAAARRADVRIRDVVVYREEFLPIIHIAVLSSENGGVPDQAMLDAVTAEVTGDDVRLLNDTLIVEAAVTNGTAIEADIWLLPTAPFAIMDTLESTLRNAWTAETGIGFDLVPSWIEARLHVPGIQRVRVRSPGAPVVTPAGGAISLGDITLNYMGRDY